MLDMIMDGVRTIFAALDRMVAFLIEYAYQLIIAIADTNVFGDLIYHYLGRIYVFLGIFMVFKLSISMINYVINPDAFTDKSKGVGKLVGNVIISLVLLVVTPNLFKAAFDLQTDLLSTNAVYQIVTGKKVSNTTDKTTNKNQLYENAKVSAKDISFSVFSAFVYKSSDNSLPCSTKTDCDTVCKQEGGTDCLLAGKTVRNDYNTYWWLLSTAVGLVVAYILLTFCFDVAMRSVKLGFLQIIAPIPIMLRMDPTAKDDKFSKWLKDVSGTFLSLFIRLGGLFFVTEIIRLIMKPNSDIKMFYTYSEYNLQDNELLYTFTRLFIIIGCLMFAKKLPQLLSDLFGIKLDGDGFSLKKKLGGLPGMGLAKMAGAGALGFAGGMAANALAAKKNFGWDKNQGFWNNMKSNALGLGKSVGSMAAGGLSGLGRGTFSKEKSLWKAGGAGAKGAIDARNLRDERRLNDDVGLGAFARRTWSKVEGAAGVQSGASGLDKMSASLSDVGSKKKAIEDYIGSLKSVDDANKALATANAIGDEAGIKTAISNLKAAKDAAWSNTSDAALQSLINNYNVSVNEANRLNPTANVSTVSQSGTRGDLDNSAKQASDANIILQNSAEWKKQHTGVKK